MRRSLAALWHGLWLNRQQQSLLTVTLSLATSLWLWLEGGRVLDVESLQNLWRSTHHPQTLFEHLLAPLAGNPDLAVAIMAVLSTLSLWLYCRLSRLIGIGPQTTFILFLLLNFNPEYNDVRLQISRFQPVLLLWLAGLYLFLAHYKNHIHLAFLGWATTAWLGALFVPIAAFWAGGFPLLFLLWPGRGNWRRRLCERGRFLLAYYGLIALIIALVPAWRHAIGDWLPELIAQIDLKRSEIAFLINADNPVDLTITEGYLVALVLVALNAIKIMGPVITILALLALSRRVLNTVLEKRVRHFHTCSLIWIWGMAAVAYLYYGYLPSDLYYTPVTMLVLWLSSGVVFYALQRIKSGRIPPERLLILLWLIIAYALAKRANGRARTNRQTARPTATTSPHSPIAAARPTWTDRPTSTWNTRGKNTSTSPRTTSSFTSKAANRQNRKTSTSLTSSPNTTTTAATKPTSCASKPNSA